MTSTSRNMKRLLPLLWLVWAAAGFSADIADPNPFLRVPGTHVGVQGGIPTTRTNIINVTSAPYYASGSDTDTTGTITSGTADLVVASASGWTTGMGITVGRKAVLTMTVTGDADGNGGEFVVKLPMCDPALIGQTYYREAYFEFAGGTSASDIAAAVRAHTGYIGWTVAGSGNDCVFTCNYVGVRPVGDIWGGFGGNPANVTVSWAITTAGLLSYTGTVAGISGTDFTLAGNATSSVTDGTVSHRDDLAIQAAIAASSAEDIIYMPAGTYICHNTFLFNDYSSRTLRGAGKNATLLEYRYTTHGIKLYKDSDYTWAQQQYAEPAPSPDNLVTSGLTAGSSTITIGDTSFFLVGQTIQLAIDNQYDNTEIAAGAVVPYAEFAFNTLRRPMHLITAKTSTTLTITPPVYFTPTSNLEVRVNRQEHTVVGVGLEDFSITSRNGFLSVGIEYTQARNCWMKNVGVLLISNYGVSLQESLFMEMRKCTITGYGRFGTNGAGILNNHTCASLFEDNIVHSIQPPFEANYSSVGNVFGYNFLNAPSYQNLTTNHAAHNSHNLFEGNVTAGMVADAFHGSSSEETLLRNWISGKDIIFNTFLSAINVNKACTYYAFIGNIYGTADHPYIIPPYDPWDFGYPAGGFATGTPINPFAGVFSPLWNNIGELTTRTSDTAGEITITTGSGDFSPAPNLALQELSNPHNIIHVTITSQVGSVITFTGAGQTLPSVGAEFRLHYRATYGGGLPEIDHSGKPSWWPVTPGSATVIGNYNAHATVAAIPAEQALGSSTIPNSYYTTREALVARGVDFGILTYPPFDPTNPGDLTSAGVARIPAGYRFLNDDNDPPASGSAANVSVQNLNVGTFVVP